MRVGTSSGKVILAGEHAVVFGHPALAVGIERGASATSEPALARRSRLTIVEWQLSVATGEGDGDLALAFGNLLDEARRNADVPDVDVEARATLVAGGGLGCSAALGVAIARSLVQDEAAVTACAMAWERVFHGNPSGIDAAVCMRGGCLRFVRGQAPRAVTMGAPLFLAIGFSGPSSRTRTMVEHIARLRESDRARVDAALARMGVIADRAAQAVERGDLDSLGALLCENQRELAALELSTPAIDRLCAIAQGAGALGSKLTGAGGGGCVVALGSNALSAERVLRAWADAGFDGFTTGVTLPTDARAFR